MEQFGVQIGGDEDTIKDICKILQLQSNTYIVTKDV